MTIIREELSETSADWLTSTVKPGGGGDATEMVVSTGNGGKAIGDVGGNAEGGGGSGGSSGSGGVGGSGGEAMRTLRALLALTKSLGSSGQRRCEVAGSDR